MLVEEKEEEDCAVWFCVTVAITISDFCVFFFILSRRYSCHPCFLLYYIISEWCCKFMCTVWTYCMCAYGGDVRVSPGRCFIFVMKYIKLTYTQARIMFISFVSFRCLSEEMQWGRVEAAGPPCRSGGCSRSDMATARSAYSKLFSHNANKTHCKQTLLERAGGTDRGRAHARAISHLRAGDLSPVSLCRRDKEGLPPRFARRHMCCSCAGRSKVRL